MWCHRITKLTARRLTRRLRSSFFCGNEELVLTFLTFKILFMYKYFRKKQPTKNMVGDKYFSKCKRMLVKLQSVSFWVLKGVIHTFIYTFKINTDWFTRKTSCYFSYFSPFPPWGYIFFINILFSVGSRTSLFQHIIATVFVSPSFFLPRALFLNH